jgi:hypothetical protein
MNEMCVGGAGFEMLVDAPTFATRFWMICPVTVVSESGTYESGLIYELKRCWIL